MKKNLLLIVTALILTTTAVYFTGCKSEEPEKPYFQGIKPKEENNAPKGAYITLFCAAIGVVLVISWGIKKLKK